MNKSKWARKQTLPNSVVWPVSYVFAQPAQTLYISLPRSWRTILPLTSPPFDSRPTFSREVNPTLGARDFSSAVSGFCQVFIVTRAFSRLRPTAEAVSAFGRQVPPHARKTSGTQGKSILFLEFPLTHIVSLTFMIDWCFRLSKPRVFCSYCFEKGGDESLALGS